MRYFVLTLLFLFFISCKKEKPIIEPPFFSDSYKEAHYFDFEGNMVKLKDRYLPIYDKNKPYEHQHFEKINESGYIYTSLKDTPWVVPTFFKIETIVRRPPNSNVESYHDSNRSYYINNVTGYSKAGGKQVSLDPFNAGGTMLIHKMDPNNRKFLMLDIYNSRSILDFRGRFFCDFINNDKSIMFNYIYIIFFSSSTFQVSSRRSDKGWACHSS